MTDRVPEHILIIDDETPLLKMMSVYLNRKGYNVTVAPTAAKARAELAGASEKNFSVVVLDATMPGAPLAEFGPEILANDPNVRLIAASGYPVDVAALEATAVGRVAFLHKPFSPEMLAAALRRMLGPKEESL